MTGATRAIGPTPRVGEGLGEPEPTHDTAATLTIDLGALAANWRQLRDRAAGAECAAVVKADAYGIGLERAVPALARAGCETFFVAHLSEAERTRALAPHAAVYVLNGLLPGAAGRYAAASARPVLGSREEIEEWAAFVRSHADASPAALHVDTGMNRLGLPLREALDWAKSGLPFAPALLMSHFVSSERPEDPINDRQIAAFEKVRAAFPDVPASLANSSGIVLSTAAHFDLVRPGYALYGGNPAPGRPNPMRPVVRLEAPIIQTRIVEAGERAGYNGQWTARRRSRLATISLGYGDGLPRTLGVTEESRPPLGGEGVVGGVRCPFAGRVSMDLIILDVTEAPDSAARRGGPVTLIGDGLDLDAVAARAGTIGYEILTSLGRRYSRRYVGEG